MSADTAGVAQLDPTAEDKRRASDALLQLLARNTDGWLAAGGLEQLATTREDKRQAREALLQILPARPTTRWPPGWYS